MIFKDNLLNTSFEENGYVVLDWIDLDGVQRLRDFCTSSGLNQVQGFSNSMNFKNAEISKQSSELIQDVFSTGMRKYMDEVEPVVASFAIKGSGEPGKISLHQDWSIVDEKDTFSANIWCALEHITFKNGCMAVLSKSHLQPFTIRGSLINNVWSEANPENIFEYWIQHYETVYIPLKPGQALIYDQRLVHFSTENLNDKSRLAATLLLTPKGRDLVHFQFFDSGINQIRIDKNFFFLDDIANLDLKKSDKMGQIQLEKGRDFVFNQVNNSIFPDERGFLNQLKRKIYKIL